MNPVIWEQVKLAFEEISDRSPEERLVVLERLEPDARRELERMLRSYDEHRDTSSDSGILLNRDFLTGIVKDQPTFEPGQVLMDRFEIVGFLGSGGMGEVFEAHDRRLGEVAIKTLPLELAGCPPVMARFRAEVERGRKVAHPNVCRIYDLFETERGEAGIPFFTMELLRGETISAAVETRGPFSASEGFPVAKQMCLGLQAAHEAQIIHGDFKCGNVILSHDPSGATRVKITDFGLSRFVRPRDAPETASPGLGGGTKPYLAPELMAGSIPSIPSDIFALGVVLFYMRAGRYPFPAETDQESARQRRLQPPSLQSLREELGETWSRAVAACLAPDPGHRPRTAIQVAAIIDGTDERRALSRRRWIGGITLAAGAALAAEGVRRYGVSDRLPPGKLPALVEDFETIGSPPAVGRAARNLLRLCLQRSTRMQVIGSAEIAKAVGALGMSSQPLHGTVSQSVAARVGAKLIIAGQVKLEGDRYRISCIGLDPATSAVLLARHEITVPLGSMPLAAARLAAFLRKQVGDDVSLAQMGDVPFEQADTDQADALESFTLGLSYFHLGEPEPALEYLREATRIDPQFAVAYVFQTIVHASYRREDLALPCIEKAYELRDRLNLRHRHHADYLYFTLHGDFEQAHRELRILTQLFPDEATYHRQFANSCTLLGKSELGLESARKAALLDPGNALNQSAFVSALAETDHLVEARGALAEAMKRSPGAAPLLFCSAYVHMLSQEIDEALTVLRDLVRRSSKGTLSRAQTVKALMLGGRLVEARNHLQTELPVIELSGELPSGNVYRYWLGQLAGIMGERETAVHQAEILSRLPPAPSSLEAFRWAAELAWYSGSPDLAAVAGVKIRQAQQAHGSTRGQGFFHFAQALEAAGKGDANRAEEEFRTALGFWPDLTTTWAFGEVLLRRKRFAEALALFQKGAAARVCAIRFDAVNVWVRCLARTAVCLEAIGRSAEAASYWQQFQNVWGAPAQYQFSGWSPVEL